MGLVGDRYVVFFIRNLEFDIRLIYNVILSEVKNLSNCSRVIVGIFHYVQDDTAHAQLYCSTLRLEPAFCIIQHIKHCLTTTLN